MIPGSSAGDVFRLLEDGLGAAQRDYCDDDEAGGAHQDQVWPVLAQPRHRDLRLHARHHHGRDGTLHLHRANLPSLQGTYEQDST